MTETTTTTLQFLAKRTLVVFGLVLNVTGATSCVLTPPDACGFGERLRGAVCEPVTSLTVNVDERVEINANGQRSGIGVNACTSLASETIVVDETENCTHYRHTGRSYSPPFVGGNAGAVVVELADRVVLLPDAEQSCYGNDLFPARDDLFAEGELFRVSGSGSGDFPEFDVEVTGPGALVVDLPTTLSTTDDFALEWLAGDADYVFVSLTTFNEASDETRGVGCVFDDDVDGERTVPKVLVGAAFTAGTVSLAVLRQNWRHLEPAGEEVAIDVVATTSLVKDFEAE